ILEDVLDLVQMHRLYLPSQEKPQEGWRQHISESAMLSWLQSMTHPDAHPAFFNDAACGIALTYNQLAKYAETMGIHIPPPLKNNMMVFPDHVTIQDEKATLIFDVGKIGPDYLPGHAHADTLSFEFSLNDQRIFVNSGVSCYDNSEER